MAAVGAIPNTELTSGTKGYPVVSVVAPKKTEEIVVFPEEKTNASLAKAPFTPEEIVVSPKTPVAAAKAVTEKVPVREQMVAAAPAAFSQPMFTLSKDGRFILNVGMVSHPAGTQAVSPYALAASEGSHGGSDKQEEGNTYSSYHKGILESRKEFAEFIEQYDTRSIMSLC